MTAVMQPEIQKIQKKYKGKKDQLSAQKMNEETMAVYEKYGVSPTGSCGQLLIQFPLIIALYQIIYRIPAYITSVRQIFDGLVEKIMGVNGFMETVNDFIISNKVAVTQLSEKAPSISNQLVDFLYKLNPAQWGELAEVDKFSSFSDVITTTAANSAHVNQFLGMDISNTPWNIMKESFVSHSWLLLFAAVMIPVLAWFTQWLNTRMMQRAIFRRCRRKPHDELHEDHEYDHASDVCSILSDSECRYWYLLDCRCGGPVSQQIIINKHMAKVDLDDLIRKNQEKAAKKREKRKGFLPENLAAGQTECPQY